MQFITDHAAGLHAIMITGVLCVAVFNLLILIAVIVSFVRFRRDDRLNTESDAAVFERGPRVGR